MINVFQPTLSDDELEAVRQVFESNWLGKGRLTDRFESQFADYVDVNRSHVRSISCCTEGLFQAMDLLGVGEGDEVILSSISFLGAANAVLAAGARPVFCDVDHRSLNVTAATVEPRITDRTRAVIVLHYGGVPTEMNDLCELIETRGISLVEDSACSVASRYRGQACGTFGDVGVWSFDSMKILVTGDGGMVYCRSEEAATRLEESTYLGLISESGFSSKARDRWWEFEVSRPGRRAIMNDITSAIGLVQLTKLPEFIARRQRIHAYYDEGLGDLSSLELPPAVPEYVDSSYYFYWIQCPPECRDLLASHLRNNDIYTTFRYYPLHRVQRYGADDILPGADSAADRTLCIPIHQALSDSDVERVVSTIREFSHKFLAKVHA